MSFSILAFKEVGYPLSTIIFYFALDRGRVEMHVPPPCHCALDMPRCPILGQIDKHGDHESNLAIGERAAQVVPHVHFHIIPRPAIGTNQRTSFAMFGRGQREELDDDEAEVLAREMRLELVEEVKRIQRDEGVDLAQELVPEGSHRGKL